MSESNSLARLAMDWLISEGVISAEKTTTGAYLLSAKHAMENSTASPNDYSRRLTVHHGRVICAIR